MEKLLRTTLERVVRNGPLTGRLDVEEAALEMACAHCRDRRSQLRESATAVQDR
jgi:hypothetical protein